MFIERNDDLVRRAAVHGALADPSRLAIIDALLLGDRSPSELQSLLSIPSNLFAHHVGVLEKAGVLRRSRSEGDRRRTYLRLLPAALESLIPTATLGAARVVFVCTHNSARSQLAAALWERHSAVPGASAGTHPAPRVHRGAVATAHRHGLPLQPTAPRRIDDVAREDDMIIAVCDNAHEELVGYPTRTHWSIADPVRDGSDDAFDRAFAELDVRITRLAHTVHSTADGES